MSLVVTGASGKLGRRTAELLLNTDGVDATDVVLITRSPDELLDLASRGAQVRHGDFANPDTLPAAFAGATRVLVISADTPGVRVGQHRAAIQAASAAGAQLIAYTSIPNPDPDRNPALVTSDHAATEAAILSSGVPHTFLRNALYSEIQIPPAQRALAAGTHVHNFGDGACAYVSREDCAAAGAAVLAGGDEHADKAYDITGPELLTGAELAALYATVGGREVEAVSVDDATWIAGAVAQGMPEPVAEVMASFGRAIRAGALAQLSGAVEQLTGRKPVGVGEVLAGAAPLR